MTDNVDTNAQPTDNAPGGGQQPAQAEQRTFTQAELDAAIRDRLQRQRDKYADYDKLKADAEKLATIEAANKTEAEKLAERVQKAEQAAQDATSKARARILAAELRAVATELGFTDPADAGRLLDAAALEVNDNGEVPGLKDALSKLAEAKPYLLKSRAPSLPSTNPGNGQQPGKSEAQQLREAYGMHGVSIFNPTEAARLGGGVFFPDEK
jgi:hypothetical protein